MAEKLGRIVFFIGSRANYGRLYSVIAAARRFFDVKIILAASGLWEDIEADETVSCLMLDDGLQEMSLTSGLLQIQITNILNRLKPDFLFVHGDRYEVLDVVQAAAYMNIPVAHTEGGELTGTIDDKVRYAISSLADYHFVVSKQSQERVEAIGRHKKVYVVGSTAIDNVKRLNLNTEPKDFVLVLAHPNTTEHENIEPLIEALIELGKPVTWINPNVDAGYKHILKNAYKSGFTITKHLHPDEYYKLLASCSVLVGNTSSGIKEGGFLGIPYVCIGHRQKDREHDMNVHFVDVNKMIILDTVNEEYGDRYPPSLLFGDGHSGERIVKVLYDTWNNMRQGR